MIKGNNACVRATRKCRKGTQVLASPTKNLAPTSRYIFRLRIIYIWVKRNICPHEYFLYYLGPVWQSTSAYRTIEMENQSPLMKCISYYSDRKSINIDMWANLEEKYFHTTLIKVTFVNVFLVIDICTNCE